MAAMAVVATVVAVMEAARVQAATVRVALIACPHIIGKGGGGPWQRWRCKGGVEGGGGEGGGGEGGGGEGGGYGFCTGASIT